MEDSLRMEDRLMGQDRPAMSWFTSRQPHPRNPWQWPSPARTLSSRDSHHLGMDEPEDAAYLTDSFSRRLAALRKEYQESAARCRLLCARARAGVQRNQDALEAFQASMHL